MDILNIARVTALPGTLAASTLYLVRNAGSADHIDAVLTGTTASEVRRLISRDDVTTMLNNRISALTAAEIPSLPGNKITSDISVNTSGNAATATLATLASNAVKLQTPRKINGTNFDGSADITVPAVDTATPRIAQSAIGVTIPDLDENGVLKRQYLPTGLDNFDEFPTRNDFPVTGTKEVVYVAADTNLMYRWSGTVYVALSAGGGLADEATRLHTPRNLSLTGDATATLSSFDGSANVSATLTLSATGIAAGWFTKIRVDAKGRALEGASLAATDIPMLDYNKVSSAVGLKLAENQW